MFTRFIQSFHRLLLFASFTSMTLTLTATSARSQELRSPNGNFVMTFSLGSNGTPTYQLTYKGKPTIKPSALGFELKGDSKSLLNEFVVTDTKTTSHDSSWEPVWGE